MQTKTPAPKPLEPQQELHSVPAGLLALGDVWKAKNLLRTGGYFKCDILVAGGRIDLDRTTEEFGIGARKSKLPL